MTNAPQTNAPRTLAAALAACVRCALTEQNPNKAKAAAAAARTLNGVMAEDDHTPGPGTLTDDECVDFGGSFGW